MRRFQQHRNQQQQQQKKKLYAASCASVELPLLETSCSVVAAASYYAVRPFIDAAIQLRLARRALQSKSASNIRLANGSYNSLFFDASAHKPLTPLIVEGDAQALIFSFQRANTLLLRARQLIAVFSAERETAASILQVFQSCALDLFQVVQHARTIVCKMPVLFCGTEPNAHLLLELRDWAVQLREMCYAAEGTIRHRCAERDLLLMAQCEEKQHQQQQQQQREDAENQRRHAEAENDRAVLEVAQCRGLLFSDCASITAPEMRRDIEKAERWLSGAGGGGGNSEMEYIADGLRELIARWTSNRSIGLLLCYGTVVDKPKPGVSAVAATAAEAALLPAMNANANHSSSSSSTRRAAAAAGSPSPSVARSSCTTSSVNRHDNANRDHDDDDDDNDNNDGYEDIAEEEQRRHQDVLHQLQLSLQRMQLFLGAKMTAAAWRQQQSTSADVDTSRVSAAATARRQVIKQQLRQRFQQVANVVPEHIASSTRFASLPTTEKMELITTVRALTSVFHTWRRWLRLRKEKVGRIDAVMRKNAVLHCLWRFRVWQRHQSECRAARRSKYGVIERGKRATEYELSHAEKGCQTLAPAPSRFMLKMVN